MRILMLTTRMDIGGAESHLLTLSREIVRLGHRVVVASAGGRSVAALEEAGVRHVTLPLDKKDPVSVWLSREGILRIMERFNPDVVHSHSRIPSFIYGELTERSEGAPLVTTVHMPFSYDPLTEWGDAQIAVSRDLAQYLGDKYAICPDGVAVIENGVEGVSCADAETSRASVRDRLGIPEGAVVVCSASRSSASRASAALYLAKNAPRLLREGEYLLLCLSGAVGYEDDLAHSIRLTAERANATLGRSAVKLIEGESDITPYLAASDIFVGVSRAAIEAMALGIPVIIAGNEGVGGLLTPESFPVLRCANLTGRGSTHTLRSIDGMLDLLRDTEYRRTLGGYSRSVAGEVYSARAMAESTLAVYRGATRPSLLVIGHYGAGNRGDDASREVLCEQLSDRWSLRFISRSRGECEGGISRLDARRIWRAARRADAVILGTGNIIQDETSLRSLAYYRAVQQLCRRANPRLAVFANGIGPLTHTTSERLARSILGSAEYVSLRDPDSAEYARALGIPAQPHLGADIVLLLDGADRGDVPLPEWGEYIAVCPRRGQSARDTEALRGFIREQKKQGVRAVYIPMDEREDTPLCLELAGEERERVLTGADARLIAAVISRARATVGGRLHAAVLSASRETPFVCYDGDGRLASFCAYSECGECLISGSFDSHELSSALERECARHTEHPYACRIDPLRAAAREDFARLREWIEK